MAAFQIKSPFSIFTDVDGDPLKDGYIYIGTAGLNPETNPVTVYFDEALTIPAAQPIRTLDGYPSQNGSPANIYTGVSFSVTVKNKNGTLVFSQLTPSSAGNQSVSDVAALIKLDSANSGDTLNVAAYHPGWQGTATGPVGGGTFVWDSTKAKSAHNGGTIISPTVPWDGTQGGLAAFLAGTGETNPSGNGCWMRIGHDFLDVSHFGADKTGANNATASVKKMFDVCIASGQHGHISAGTYMMTAGQLVFDSAFTDKLWPEITTDGHEAVTFKRADATNAPFIHINNGTATSGVSNTWNGGSLGGITFDQNSQTTAAGQHGIVLRGIVGTNFGWMRGNDLGGSCIFLEQKLFGGSNPDPYNVSNCKFRAAEGNRCKGASFYNDNFVGFAGCRIEYIRAIENVNGAFFGFGAANTVDVMSVGSCSGWALGNDNSGTGGSATRFKLGIAEFDDVQNGIDIRRVSNSDFGTVRFVHRYNFGPLNPSGGYWPRLALQASSANPVTMLDLNIIDRIETGGTKPDLGQFFDFGIAGGQLTDIRVRRQTQDNAGFGFVATDFYTNFNSNTKVVYTDAQGAPILDTLKKVCSLARAATTFALPSGGFTTGANTVQYGTELADPSSSYNPTTWTYTCIGPGQYRIAARIILAVAIGTRIRMAVMVNGSVDAARNYYATTANAVAYEIIHEVNITAAGATININADQNTGSPVNLTTMSSVNENNFSVSRMN